MKKLLIGLLGLIVVLVAAVLIVPGFIDWNVYKKEIQAQAKAATGRDLTIGGDIKIAVLPTPTLSAANVSLANVAGAAKPMMATLKSIEVRVAFAPLLSGKIQVETVKLVDPIIELEILADGRKNWDFGTPAPVAKTGAPAAPGKPTTGAAPAAASGGGMPPVRLDSFTVENGTLVYRDAKAGKVERIEALNAKIAAASLSGPFESAGSLKARGMALKYDVTVGRIIEQRTVPMNLNIAAGDAKAQVNGTLVNLTAEPKFRGKIAVDGSSLAGLIQHLAGTDPLPPMLGQRFGVGGAVVAAATGAEIKDLEIRLGDSKATGTASAKWEKGVQFAVQLGVARIDLDKWLAEGKAAPAVPAKDQKQTKAAPTTKPKAPAPAAAAKPASAPDFAIPRDVSGSFGLTIGAISYRGGLIGQTQAKIDVAEGEITVSQLSAQMPGSTDVALFGFVTAPQGKPKFDGDLEMAVGDLRAVLRWLNIETPPLPADRLRNVRFKSKVAATPEHVQASNMNLAFDGSKVTGGVTVALRDRPSFGADLTIDQINVDSYMPPAAKASGGGAAAAPADGKPAATDAPTKAADPLSGMTALTAFDANLKAHVRQATYQGTPIKDAVLDGTLFNGMLTLRRLSVGNVAGASLNVVGVVDKLAGVPEMKNLRFDFKAPDVARLFRLAGVDAPPQAKGLGAVQASGRLDGAVLKPRMDLSLKAAGATVTAAAKTALLPPAIDGRIGLEHGDLVKLLKTLGVDYRPAGTIGAVSFAADVKATAAGIALSGIKGTAGNATVAGDAAVAMAGSRPKITANLTAGEIQVDTFMPAKKTASLVPEEPRAIPADWRPDADRRGLLYRTQARRAPAAPARRGQWSVDPIDLSALKSFDADIQIKAKAIAFDKYRVDDADVALQLASAVMKTERLKGRLFGGALDGNLQLDANGVPKTDAVVSLKNADVGQAVKAFTGQASAAGQIGMNLKLATTGKSMKDMIGALGGNGDVQMTRLDVRGAAKGSALSGALDLVASLGKLGGSLGGKKGGALADISGTFLIEKGIARSDDIKLASGFGNGQAKGTVDLPAWAIDMAGQIDLEKNALNVLLDRKGKVPDKVPFQIKGPLDAPNVKIETAGLAVGGAAAIPGVDKLLKKKGVGDVLQGIMGGQPAQPEQPQQQQQQQPQPPPPAEKKKIRPEDLLKGLFR